METAVQREFAPQPGHYDMDGITPNLNRLANGLIKLLADSTMLYLKTYDFHWNLSGPMAQTLRGILEKQYHELALAVDQIDNRIRNLGYCCPTTFPEIIRLSSISDSTGVYDPDQMLVLLIEGQEEIINTARDVYSLAQEAGDKLTIDFLNHRMNSHEKTAWMLRSLMD